LAQLAMWYEFRPAAPGEALLVEARLAPDAWNGPPLELTAPDVVTIEGSVPDELHRTITWRIRPEAAAAEQSPLTLHFALGDDDVAEKQLAVSNTDGTNELVFVSPLRAGANFWDRLLNPGESAVDQDSPIQQIKIRYDHRANTLCGLKIHWLVTFFVVSVLAALALKPVIKVQF